MKDFEAWRRLWIINVMVGSTFSVVSLLVGNYVSAVLLYLLSAYGCRVVWSVKDLVGEGE